MVITKRFEHEFDFVYYIDDLISEMRKDGSEGFESIDIYGKSNFIASVFTELISEYDYQVGFIDFACGFYDEDYQSEYVLVVNVDREVSIDRVRLDHNKIACPTSDYIYIHESCDKDIMNTYAEEGSVVYLLKFGEKPDSVTDNFVCNGDCECCHEYILNNNTDSHLDEIEVKELNSYLDGIEKKIDRITEKMNRLIDMNNIIDDLK